MARLTTIKDEGIAARINENAVAMPDSRTAISYWSNFYFQPRESDDVASTTIAMMNEDPALLRQIATPRAEQHTNTMATEVAADRTGVYAAVSEQYAVAVADELIGSAEYKAGKNANRTGNGREAALIALHPNKPIFAEVVALASTSAIQKGLENKLTRTRTQEFITNNIIKTDGTINRTGLAGYDSTQTGALPTDKRKEYDVSVGFQYTKEQDATHFQ